MLQQAESGEQNEKLLEKNCLFSSKGNERKWVIELLLKGRAEHSEPCGWGSPMCCNTGDGEAQCRLQREMHLSWAEMVLKAQKSLKKTKICYWREAGIYGFVAHWHKTSRFFFSTDTRWKF